MNHQPKWRDINGFSLVELLVALLITGIMMAMIISVFLMSQKIYTHGGDISYKQKSITNIETDLQNALARAAGNGVKIDYSTPSGNYSIGFKDGICVEVINGEYYQTDQISQIDLSVTNVNTLNYVITPKDTTMSQLKGGIIMNNVKTSPFTNETFKDGTKYLNVTYETGS